MTTTLGAAKGRSPVRTMLFAYACALLASYANSSFGYLDADEREIGDHTMVTVLALIFVGLALCDGVRSRDRLYFLLRVIVVCGTIVATIGILQFLFGFDLTPLLRPPGMHFSSFDSSVRGRDGLSRAAGTTSNPLEFGVFCAMVLPLAIHVAFRATRAAAPTLWWTCAGLIGTGLMFSVSRSAILGLTAADLVLFIGWPTQRRVWMAAAGFGFLVVIKFLSPGCSAPSSACSRTPSQDSSVQWRTHDYATAQELISQHLWLGRGTRHLVRAEARGLRQPVPAHPRGQRRARARGVPRRLRRRHLRRACGWGSLCAKPPEGRVATTATDRDLALSLAASVAVDPPDLRDVRLRGVPDRVGDDVPAGRDRGRAAADRDRRGRRGARRPLRDRLTLGLAADGRPPPPGGGAGACTARRSSGARGDAFAAVTAARRALCPARRAALAGDRARRHLDLAGAGPPLVLVVAPTEVDALEAELGRGHRQLRSMIQPGAKFPNAGS